MEPKIDRVIGAPLTILALTDALGNLVRFVLLPGNRYDTVGVAPLIKGLTFDALLGDKAYDSNWIVEEMNARGALILTAESLGFGEPATGRNVRHTDLLMELFSDRVDGIFQNDIPELSLVFAEHPYTPRFATVNIAREEHLRELVSAVSARTEWIVVDAEKHRGCYLGHQIFPENTFGIWPLL